MSNLSTKPNKPGVEILVRGTVQGVGFRPFVYNLASRFGVTGSVSNSGEGVVIHAYTRNDRLKLFIDAISEEAPPLSRISSISSKVVSSVSAPQDFTIITSAATGNARTAIPPDIALCDDCYNELTDPTDQRYHYPFTNCTNCGPRFTIVETIPYDRPKTSMKVFPMCDVCNEEYHDPSNRRFHAQPNACPSCGPSISWHDSNGKSIDTDPIDSVIRSLIDDKTVALRGLGGFHLIVNGCSPTAIDNLRKRKGRPDKPLAIMVADIKSVETICQFSPEEAKLLLSPEHPIVLLPKKAGSQLAENLAPNIDDIGVMLPYTPLHHLLFQHKDCPDALVMTSGNVSGTPICTANDDAIKRLSTIADFFLLHNRDIVTRVDDSVAKIIAGKPRIFRRARGFVPAPIEVPYDLPQILGCGGGLKSTFCLGRENSAFVSQHIGDLTNLESYDFYTESIEHFKRVFQIVPEVVACDLHPDYMSTHFAKNLGLPLYTVQHHHAHAVAVMAEHGLDQPVLAVILDGTGYGTDKTIWGGEILQCDLNSFSRAGNLTPLQLPGGDVATAEPWRMAISALFHTFGEYGLRRHKSAQFIKQVEPANLDVISSMLQNDFNCPLTSSCGRLFDAIAAILGVRQFISYEGQAAIELESLAKRAITGSWLTDIMPNRHNINSPLLREKDGKWEICSAEFVKLVLDDLACGVNPATIALRFHQLLIKCITELIQHLSSQTNINQVVLSGGCMQNSILLEGFFHTLSNNNFEVFTGETLPINDGAVSFGQTIIGGLQHVSSNTHESN